jgi:glycosyltransferase involved in cell wall biosynthesis
MVKFLHITSTDLRGAGSAVTTINNLLIDTGYHSKVVTVYKTKKDENVIGFMSCYNPFLKKMIDRLILRFHKIKTRIKLGKVDANYFFYNLDERRETFYKKKIIKKIDYNPDVIFIHWVSNFINSKEIANLQKLTGAKICWFMIDNAPITGGCHYPHKCKGYETTCSDCPALLSPSKKYVAERNLKLKCENLPDDLIFLSASSTDKERLHKSAVFCRKKDYTLPVPINIQTYYKRTKDECFTYFNIPKNKKIIFFAATNLDEKRKGFIEFKQAISLFENHLEASNIPINNYLILFAGNSPIYQTIQSKIPMVSLGYLSEKEFSMAINCATVFVSPSLEDSGPAIVGQSLCCGTPVVAFNTGIAVDVIKNDITGYLAELGNAADLENGIFSIVNLSESDYEKMSENCVEIGLNRFSSPSIMKKKKKIIEL